MNRVVTTQVECKPHSDSTWNSLTRSHATKQREEPLKSFYLYLGLYRVCVCVSAQWVNGDFLWFNAVWGWKRLNVCAQQRNSAGGILKSKTIKLSGVWCPPYSMPLKNCRGEFKTPQPYDASLRIWYFYTEGGVHIICTQEVLWKRRGGEKKRERAV